MAVRDLVVARRAVRAVDRSQFLVDGEADGFQEVRRAQAQAVATALDERGVMLVAAFVVRVAEGPPHRCVEDELVNADVDELADPEVDLGGGSMQPMVYMTALSRMRSAMSRTIVWSERLSSARAPAPPRRTADHPP